MKRSAVYDVFEAWLRSHGFDTGYRLQRRFWSEQESTKRERYLVMQQAGGGATEEALTWDYFRFLLITEQNDRETELVEDNADAIRQAMLDDHRTECIILMRPVGGIPTYKTKEGRYLFEINFQTIISRQPE